MTVSELLPAGLEMAPDAAARLDSYVNQLCAWNKVLNLAGATEKAVVVEDLILDSFYLARLLDRLFANPERQAQIWDLGAGAGLPGLPLRLLWPKGSYFLVEARQKRALFMKNAILQLQLANTKVCNCRVEKFFSENKNATPLCILSRAFMPWQKLLDFCAPALKTGIIIIMANEPPGELPASWKLVDQLPYQAGKKPRWLWALQQEVPAHG